ncbi:MAG TPA: rod shape-determining protein MreC [Nevskia sp.]|nr:rod shape-determining protein MreC [Nevskia sp.]
MNTLSDAARKTLSSRGPGLGLKFLLFASLSIGMIVSDYRGDSRLRPVREWTARLLQPLLWVTALPGATADLGEHFRSRQELLTENQALRQKQLELEGRVLRMDALEAENERIRELLSSAASLQTRVLIAEILSVSQDPYRHQIVLNKGERDGVYKGQALVDASGIMGQVIEVNSATSVALLITDPDHGLPVEINRTGLQTIALGSADGQGLSLPFLPGNADVKVGDLLVSSGLGGRFPAGYPVGKVNALSHPAGESFMTAIAWPSARLSQGRQALLVWSERPAAQEPDNTAERVESPGAARKPAEKPALKPSQNLSDKAPPKPAPKPAEAPRKPPAAAQPPAPAAPAPAKKPAAPAPAAHP